MRSIFEQPISSIEELRKEWAPCTKCVFSSLWKNTCPCLPLGNSTNKEVLVVGQWPGEKDMQNGVPFSGPQGRVCTKMLCDAGFDAGKLLLTNVLLCACPMIPNKEILTNCAKQIDDTIDITRPKIIVALGKYAATRFGIRKSMSLVHGKLAIYRNHKVVPCIHPAAIARAGSPTDKADTERKVMNDLTTALRIYEGNRD